MFHTPVGKGKIAALAVAVGGEVDPAVVRGGPDQEMGVINAILILVQEDEQLGWLGDLASRPHGLLAFIVPAAQVAIHGIAASARQAKVLPVRVADAGLIRRAAVKPRGAVVVQPEKEAVLDAREVGVMRRAAIANPGVGNATPNAIEVLRQIERQIAAMIVAVGLPAKLELPEIVEALHHRAPRFGVVDGGKDERGEEGNDGDDDQQFKQGEAGTVLSRVHFRVVHLRTPPKALNLAITRLLYLSDVVNILNWQTLTLYCPVGWTMLL
jgi:hypothetical protein